MHSHLLQHMQWCSTKIFGYSGLPFPFNIAIATPGRITESTRKHMHLLWLFISNEMFIMHLRKSAQPEISAYFNPLFLTIITA